MSDLHDDDTRLNPEDDAFVRRISDAYVAPRRTVAQRVAFQAKLESRLRGRSPRGRLVWGLAASAVAAGAVFLLQTDRLPSATVVDSTAAVTGPAAASSATAAVQQEAILALAIDPETRSDAALPAEYEAIASVFLGS